MTAIVNGKVRARVEEAWRKLAGTAFVRPPARESARYALMEATEMDDASMRQERPADARNNARNVDPRKEWGQAGFMLLTALGGLPEAMGLLDRHVAHGDALWTYGAFLGTCANFLQECSTNHPFARSGQSLVWAWMYWKRYCDLREWHAYDLIDETCRAFEAKHVPGWGASLESDASEAVQHDLPAVGRSTA